MLTVAPGQSFLGDDVSLPDDAVAMIRRIGPVEAASPSRRSSASVRRTDVIPPGRPAACRSRPSTRRCSRRWAARSGSGPVPRRGLDRYPAVVLGDVAAERLGIYDLDAPVQVFIGGRWFTVVGIIDPLPLAPELDRAALMGGRGGRQASTRTSRRRAVYVRATRPMSTRSGRSSAPRPTRSGPRRSPSAGRRTRSRPRPRRRPRSRRCSSGSALVALAVGPGHRRPMLIAFIERRSEIGLRRALGATRGAIAVRSFREALPARVARRRARRHRRAGDRRRLRDDQAMAGRGVAARDRGWAIGAMAFVGRSRAVPALRAATSADGRALVA